MQPDRLVAISVVTSPNEESRIVDAWEEFSLPVELRTVFSPYRDLTQPILDVIDDVGRADRPGFELDDVARHAGSKVDRPPRAPPAERGQPR